MPNDTNVDDRIDDGVNTSNDNPDQRAKNLPSDEEWTMGGNPGAGRQFGASGSRSSYSLMDKSGPRGLNLLTNDNMSENSSQAPPTMVRSKSKLDMFSSASSRYQNLSYWKARRMVFYRNGDPFFPGIEYRFKPGRDISTLETLLDKISPKMDLPRGARYVFSMDGDRKYTLEELEDGASYVVSSTKTFKVS